MTQEPFEQPTGRRSGAELEPLCQGDLDGLCGVYSVVNAVRTLCPEASDTCCEQLFRQLMKRLSKDGRTPAAVVCNGLGTRRLRSLVECASKFATTRLDVQLHARKLRKPKRRNMSTSKLWRILSEELSAGRVAILRLGGRENHWTLAVRITERQIRLLDSSGRQVLQRSRCTIGDDATRVILHVADITVVERLGTR